MSSIDDSIREEAARYWRTSICDISPGKISFRGYQIQDLIGEVSFPAMIWLMLRGEMPTHEQAKLLEAALVASVDHGPHAPSIAISRMAVSCGLPLNGAMASAINTLDDIHGGAGERRERRGKERAVSQCPRRVRLLRGSTTRRPGRGRPIRWRGRVGHCNRPHAHA